ncbi:MAG: phosphoribosyltransferase [Elusimicrobia bacterium]|nr:phosphoribosyltransferase [Elusimicrobiota bacterium]
MVFDDRAQAGRFLANRLSGYAGRPGLLVLGLPRGGVPVAFEVAQALGAPLDVFVVRKLPSPLNPELAIGAIASGGIRVLNEDTVSSLAVGPEEIEVAAQAEAVELARRERVYRAGRRPEAIRGMTVILVDDGLATGATMRAAVRAVRRSGAARVVVGVPIGSPETCAALRREADEVVCAAAPAALFAIGQWYRDFEQTTDDEVRRLLASAARARRRGAASAGGRRASYGARNRAGAWR